jgi:hypothetical protein
MSLNTEISADGHTWTLSLGLKFREADGFGHIGAVREALASGQFRKLRIDMSQLDWADAQPLLMLAAVIANAGRQNAVTIQLGGTTTGADADAHRTFLRFLATQKFLDALAEHAQLEYLLDGKPLASAKAIVDRLSRAPHANSFHSTDCITTKLLSVAKLREPQRLQEYVEDCLVEAKTFAVDSTFAADAQARDVVFQKLRKVLYEMLNNAAEHAYEPGADGHVVVFARLRRRKPNGEQDGERWMTGFREDLATLPAHSAFEPDILADWVELFVCDAGRGLDLSTHLFKAPSGEAARQRKGKPQVAGLVHLGQILGPGEDYARVYSHRTGWIGGHLPWSQPATVAPGEAICPGTAYAVYLQPNAKSVQQTGPEWHKSTQTDREIIKSALLQDQQQRRSNTDAAFFERRFSSTCSPPTRADVREKLASGARTVIVRPPRLVTRADLTDWLHTFAGHPHQPPEFSVDHLIFAETSPSQSTTFAEIFRGERVHSSAQLKIFVVAENWHVASLCTRPGETAVVNDAPSATAFMRGPAAGASISAAADLACVLREEDSRLFWQDHADSLMADIFQHGPIKWTEAGLMIDGFLDVGHALSDRERYRAARRALRRCLQLDPHLTTEATDDLISALVADASYKNLDLPDSNGHKTIAVGSVAVTKGTSARLVDRYGAAVETVVHLLIHKDATSDAGPRAIAALLWLPPPRSEPSDNTTVFERIPGTPYIAPGGRKSLSMVRYRRYIDGAIDTSDSYYPSSPEEMYSEFDRYSTLKTGHWTYQGVHHLLTVNMQLAFRSARLIRSGMYDWLLKTFQNLFSAANNSSRDEKTILVYPSHSVTEDIMAQIAADPAFKDCMPTHVFPIRFLAPRTVSPYIVSPMIERRIRNVVADGAHRWRGVVFDDDTVIGKHLRELSIFLEALGASDIKTISLLDRTGIPSRDEVMRSFRQQHKRYWRMDVPALGHRRDCTLCHALHIGEHYMHRLKSPSQRKRLKEWREMWKARDVRAHWRQDGLDAVRLAEPAHLPFAVSHPGTADEKVHHLTLRNSTNLSAGLIEITRMTAQADDTLTRAQALRETQPEVAMEILVSQLLLLIDELESWQIQERLALLLEILWVQPAVSRITALAGLCLSLVSDADLAELANSCGRRLFCEEVVKNIDAIVLFNILDARMGKPKEPPKGPAVVENSILVGREMKFVPALTKLIETIGDRSGRWHQSELYKNLDWLSRVSNHGNYIDQIQPRAQPATADFERALEIMGRSCFDSLRDRVHRGESLATMCAAIEHHTQLLKNGIVMKNRDRIQASAIALKKTLYGPGPSLHGFITEYLFQKLPRDRAISAFLDPVRAEADAVWQSMTCDKLSANPNHRWQSANGRNPMPVWRCANLHESWDEDQEVYFDERVRAALRDTLLNVFHSSEPITCPWSECPGFDDVTADMWWHAKIEANFLHLRIANAAARTTVDLKPNIGIAGLERVDGSLLPRPVISPSADGCIVFVEVRIPLMSHFIALLKEVPT